MKRNEFFTRCERNETGHVGQIIPERLSKNANYAEKNLVELNLT